MARVFGAIAIFGGWLCICCGAFLGLAGSEFLGLGHTEGPVTPQAVYGVSAAVVLWLFVVAAVLAALPMGMAMLEPDPRRRTYATAAVMTVVGLALLPDELGRAFGLPLLPGAALVALGGRLIHRDATFRALGTGEVTSVSEATSGVAVAAEDSATAGRRPEVAEPAGTAARRVAARKKSTKDRECPWCSARVPVGVSTCPVCHATVDADPAAEAIPLPGLTEVPADLRAYAAQARVGKPKRGLLSMMFSGPTVPTVEDSPAPSEPAALRPPSAAVRAEMARIGAEIAAGAGRPDPASTSPAPASGSPAPTADSPAAVPLPDTAPAPAPRRRRRPPA